MHHVTAEYPVVTKDEIQPVSRLASTSRVHRTLTL